MNAEKMRDSTFEPLNLKDDRMRVYMKHADGGKYHVYCGFDMWRVFDDSNVPDCIKIQVSLVNAFDWDAIQGIAKHALDISDIMYGPKHYYPKACRDVGWRVGDNYALLLDPKDFMELLGDPTLTPDDVRRTSKQLSDAFKESHDDA